MHASRIRASLLLFSAVACFGVRPSTAAEASLQVERVQVADGGSHFNAVTGTGEATLTATSGAVLMSPGSNMGFASFTAPEPPYIGEIHVMIGSVEDYGQTRNIDGAALMFDPTMTMVHLVFDVPSWRYPGKRLHADIKITALQLAEADPDLPSIHPNGTSVQASGPGLITSRYGKVTGQVWSDQLGPSLGSRDLKPYTGPSTPDSMAVVTDQLVENAYAKQ